MLLGRTLRKAVPEYIRSDNGSEFTARVVNGKFRNELLNEEILKEVQVLIERWQVEYSTVRPHSLLNYLPPATEVWFY